MRFKTLIKRGLKACYFKYSYLVDYKLFCLIIPEIRERYEFIRYFFLELVDPAPQRFEGESFDNWCRRINPKYALRNARFNYTRLIMTKYLYQLRTYPGSLSLMSEKKRGEYLENSRKAYLMWYEARQTYWELLDKYK